MNTFEKLKSKGIEELNIQEISSISGGKSKHRYENNRSVKNYIQKHVCKDGGWRTVNGRGHFMSC